MSNLYFSPLEYGLEFVTEVDDPQADYSFNKVVVWKRIQDDEYLWASDAGCSCPSPFEDVTLPDLETLDTLMGLCYQRLAFISGRLRD